MDINSSANGTFTLWCVQLIKSGSLNWPWCTKILGQFVTRMRQFIGQSDVKHMMTSHLSPSDIVNSSKLTVILKIIGQRDVKHIMTLSIKTITSVLKFSINITLSDSLQY
jgi:hypothetical protein